MASQPTRGSVNEKRAPWRISLDALLGRQRYGAGLGKRTVYIKKKPKRRSVLSRRRSGGGPRCGRPVHSRGPSIASEKPVPAPRPVPVPRQAWRHNAQPRRFRAGKRADSWPDSSRPHRLCTPAVFVMHGIPTGHARHPPLSCPWHGHARRTQRSCRAHGRTAVAARQMESWAPRRRPDDAAVTRLGGHGRPNRSSRAGLAGRFVPLLPQIHP